MRFGLLRTLALVCIGSAIGIAQQAVTVRQLVDFITSSITQKQPDKAVAATLAGMKMSERLTPGMVEDLQGKGAGPKTVAALSHLAEMSATLTAAAPKVEPPKPKPI